MTWAIYDFPKLDFVHLGGKGEGVGQALKESLGNMYDIGVMGRHPENGDRPKVLADEGQGIGKGGGLLGVPGSLAGG